MLSKVIEFFTKKWGWEQVAFVIGFACVTVALLSGMYWLFGGALIGVSPKVLRKSNQVDDKKDDNIKKIEEDWEIAQDKLEVEHEHVKKRILDMLEKKNKEHKKATEEQSAEEIRKRILNGIDDAGREQ